MLFAVRMDVQLPSTMDSEVRSDTIAREKKYSQELQRAGVWRHIWRSVGKYSNLSIFDVDSNQQLHELLWQLPLFPYMEIEVIPLATHPSDITVSGENA